MSPIDFAISASMLASATAIAPAATQRAMPSAIWAGVERIVVDCAASPPALSATLRERLCAAVIDEASKLASYPVVAADSVTLAPGGRPGRRDLMLRVEPAEPSKAAARDSATLSVLLRLDRGPLGNTGDMPTTRFIIPTDRDAGAPDKLGARVATALRPLLADRTRQARRRNPLPPPPRQD